MLAALVIMSMVSAARGEVAGPPAPARPSGSPAAQAMARYRQGAGRRWSAKPCRRSSTDEILVCAPTPDENSPYRLPLPEERGMGGGAPTATGELRRASAERADIAGQPRCCGGDPPKTLETIGKLIRFANGEDPD